MPYTAQGYMTAEDLEDIRRNMDLYLCACCELYPTAYDPGMTGTCIDCGHDHEQYHA